MNGPRRLRDWLRALAEAGGSDLYLTFGARPLMRREDRLEPLAPEPLDDEAIAALLAEVAGPEQRGVLERVQELNFALDLGRLGRFRVNAFRQRQHIGMVVRRITGDIPSFDDLGLPPLLGDLALARRGLIVVTGATGSGKSTTLAAMLDHRNASLPGHIVTIEDPIEFVHTHKQSLVTQREVGVDTASFAAALKNVLRQKPDVILLGEIRDAEVMDHAVAMAETGHLVMASLHANNANQAIERMLNFFDESRHRHVLLNLSLNLRAVVAQRLVATVDGGRVPALEVLLNEGLAVEQIRGGAIGELKKTMTANSERGMQCFDQALFDLARDGTIDEAVALAEADQPADLKLRLQQARLGGGDGLTGVDTSKLSL